MLAVALVITAIVLWPGVMTMEGAVICRTPAIVIWKLVTVIVRFPVEPLPDKSKLTCPLPLEVKPEFPGNR